MRKYVYFFTRQDISPEQQIVQTAHAAFQLGVNSQRITQKEWDARTGQDHIAPNEILAEETHFTVVGVRNLNALNAIVDILNRFQYRYEAFYEPDLGAGEYTSVAVYPLLETEKGVLEAFNLLRLK